MRSPKAVLIVLLLTAGLLAALFAARGPYAYFAASHLRGRLKSVADDRVEQTLRQIAALGEPGVPVLVEALGSDRPGVARSAMSVLREQLRTWQTPPRDEHSRQLAALAEALATYAPQFDHAARHDAADLAAEILRWPPDGGVVDRGRVIARCERVLRLTRPGKVPPQPDAASQPETDLAALDAPPAARETDEIVEGPPQIPVEGGEAIAGPRSEGTVPSPPDATPRPPEGAVQAPAAVASPEAPWCLPDPISAQPINPLRDTHGWSIDGLRAPLRPQASIAPDARPSLEASPEGVWRPIVPPHATPPHGAAEFSHTATEELMRQFAVGGDRSTAAQAELQRRGFGQREIDLSRRLFDQDAKVRQQLAAALPGMAGVNPVPWLLLLSRDVDADVRLTAIGLIATINDPTLLAKIEQIARRDPDARIRQQAARIATLRHGRPR